MTEENQPLNENEESTLDEERGSEEAADLESLFADDDDSQEDAPVTREEYNKLLKGVKKLASIQGQQKSQPKKEEVKTETKEVISHQDDDLSELFFAQIPKAELVQDDLKKIAEVKYGGSILKAWKGESWIQEKASVLEAARKEDEENKAKISKPSPGSGNSKVDVTKTKPEDIDKLSKTDRVRWIKAQAERERNESAFEE